MDLGKKTSAQAGKELVLLNIGKSIILDNK